MQAGKAVQEKKGQTENISQHLKRQTLQSMNIPSYGNSIICVYEAVDDIINLAFAKHSENFL